MNEDDFVKRVYEGRTEGLGWEEGVRGRPPVKWINKVDKYWKERVVGEGSSVLRRSTRTVKYARSFVQTSTV